MFLLLLRRCFVHDSTSESGRTTHARLSARLRRHLLRLWLSSWLDSMDQAQKCCWTGKRHTIQRARAIAIQPPELLSVCMFSACSTCATPSHPGEMEALLPGGKHHISVWVSIQKKTTLRVYKVFDYVFWWKASVSHLAVWEQFVLSGNSKKYSDRMEIESEINEGKCFHKIG